MDTETARQGAKQALSILQSLNDFAATDVAESFRAVGAGIGSVMMLIVLFYYLVSLLDGGKFQLKMMVPFVIFMFVCNFSWISRPVTSFTSAVCGGLVDALDGVTAGVKASYGAAPTATLADLQKKMQEKYVMTNYGPVVKRELDSLTVLTLKQVDEMYGNSTYAAQAAGYHRGYATDQLQKGLAAETAGAYAADAAVIDSLAAQAPNYAEGGETGSSMVARGLSKVGHATAYRLNSEMTTTPAGPETASYKGVIEIVISFVCELMGYVLRAFGGLMSAIIVAFGPVTFAFAIMPGQARTVKSWFIRLCQFSLYAPICALVQCFSVKIFDFMYMTSGVGSVLMGIAVSICNLVALTSVPSIAAMIIEGASGAISLSQGLQAIGGAVTGGLTAGKTIAGGAGTAILGKERMDSMFGGVRDSAAGAAQKGLVGFGIDANSQGLSGAFDSMKGAGASERARKAANENLGSTMRNFMDFMAGQQGRQGQS